MSDIQQLRFWTKCTRSHQNSPQHPLQPPHMDDLERVEDPSYFFKPIGSLQVCPSFEPTGYNRLLAVAAHTGVLFWAYNKSAYHFYPFQSADCDSWFRLDVSVASRLVLGVHQRCNRGCQVTTLSLRSIRPCSST